MICVEFSYHGNDRGSSMARLKARVADEHRPHRRSDHRDPVRADLRRNPTSDQLRQPAGAAQPQTRPAATRSISSISTVLSLKTDSGRRFDSYTSGSNRKGQTGGPLIYRSPTAWPSVSKSAAFRPGGSIRVRHRPGDALWRRRLAPRVAHLRRQQVAVVQDHRRCAPPLQSTPPLIQIKAELQVIAQYLVSATRRR